MIRRLSHAHHPFSLHESVSVMPNLGIYFLHYPLYTALVIMQRFLLENGLRIRMSSHTCAPKGHQAFPTRSRLWCQTQRATTVLIALSASIHLCCDFLKKKARERRPKSVAGEKELPLLLSTNLGSSGHVPVCVLGLFHIPLALLQPNCFVGPHQLSPKQRN